MKSSFPTITSIKNSDECDYISLRTVHVNYTVHTLPLNKKSKRPVFHQVYRVCQNMNVVTEPLITSKINIQLNLNTDPLRNQVLPELEYIIVGDGHENISLTLYLSTLTL